MQKKTLCAALCLAICLTLSSHAAASSSTFRVAVDGVALETEVPGEIYNQVTYVHYWPILEAFDPNATATWKDGMISVQAGQLALTIHINAKYLEANGRYFYLPNGVLMRDGLCLLPATTLARVLGGTAWWDKGANILKINVGEGTLLPGSSYYNADSVRWLSHIIYAESGNQPLEGKIAVGNVILNRVSSPAFPNTIYDVIFQRNQFTPVSNGSINATPNSESVLAAKLCLDGANTAGNALFFINPNTSPNSWAARNRSYVTTIGAHAFFA